MAIFKTVTRKISNRGQLKIIGQFFSHKNNTSISWESQVERDYFYLLEYLDDVVSYLHQPKTFQFWVDGVKRSYTPDVQTIHKSGEIKYSEVKFKLPAPDSDMAARLTAAKNHFQEIGHSFELVDAKNIRSDQLVKNIKLLYRYAKWDMEKFPGKEVIDFISKHPDLTIGDAIYEFSPNSAGGLFRMIYEKLIVTDLRCQQINYASKIYINTL